MATVGAAQVASLVIVNLQTSISWAVGYAVPLAAFALALAVYLAGTPLYRRVPPGGAALTRIARARRGPSTAAARRSVATRKLASRTAISRATWRSRPMCCSISYQKSRKCQSLKHRSRTERLLQPPVTLA
jgi:hypothetical protein